MATVVVATIILLFVINGVYGLYEEHRKGILCDCTGDCATCKIQCRSNEKYYGTKQIGVPKARRKAYEESLRPENQPVLIRGIRKVREVLDLICYWIFNLFGIFAVGSLLYGMVFGFISWVRNLS